MGVFIPDGYSMVRLGWRCTGDQETMVSTFGVQHPIASDPQTVAGLIHDNYLLTAGKPADSLPSYIIQPTSITHHEGTEIVEAIAGTPVAGTNAAVGGPLPVNCAVLLTKRTARAGRKGRGRMYLPPFQSIETGVDAAGFIAPADITALTTRWASFRTALIAVDLLPVLLHADELDTPNLITSWAIEGQIATQRRRLR